MSKIEEKPISALMLTDRPIEIEQRFNAIITKPDIVERICDFVANGGSLVTLCRMWVVSYAKVMKWIKTQPFGEENYKEALKLREEWEREMVTSNMHSYAQADVRDLFDDKGHIINPKDLSDEIAPAVQSVQIKTRSIPGRDGDDGEIETTFDVKLIDKTKVTDMLNRRQGNYIDKTEHSGSVNLVDIIAGSYKKNEPPKS